MPWSEGEQGASCGDATLRTSPSSGQATTGSELRFHTKLACHLAAALAASDPEAGLAEGCLIGGGANNPAEWAIPGLFPQPRAQ
jgi:hypothetical protein